MPPFNQTPDQPQSFGYKTLWFSIKTSDPALVVDAFESDLATPANWASSLAAAYSNSGSQAPGPWVFVSPPINGWVLATCAQFPYPVTIDAHHDIGRKFDVLFSRLMKRFDDVQFFGSHRVVDFATWARSRGGKPVRVFGFADGEVLANLGEQTAEDARLGFVNLSGMPPADACEKIFAAMEESDIDEDQASEQEDSRDAIPDENDVIDLAALWSIDPTQLSEQDHPPGLGFAVRLPNNLTQ